MIQRIFLISFIFIYGGCMGTKVVSNQLVEDKKVFCERSLELKSLEFLAQEYKCTKN